MPYTIICAQGQPLQLCLFNHNKSYGDRDITPDLLLYHYLLPCSTHASVFHTLTTHIHIPYTFSLVQTSFTLSVLEQLDLYSVYTNGFQLIRKIWIYLVVYEYPKVGVDIRIMHTKKSSYFITSR